MLFFVCAIFKCSVIHGALTKAVGKPLPVARSIIHYMTAIYVVTRMCHTLGNQTYGNQRERVNTRLVVVMFAMDAFIP